MKIFKIVSFLALWLTLFVACAVAFYLHPEMGWSLVVAAVIGIIIMFAASMFINEAFD